MRCLGVPNTKHFHDITLIEDVLTLYEKIKADLANEQFVLERHEEFEDSQGNVLDRKTYEDLARQGLL
jgi:splicing factor 3A subunit 3